MPEEIFAHYRVRGPGANARALDMQVFLNVKRLWVYYKFPTPTQESHDKLVEAMAVTFDGAKGAGYAWSMARQNGHTEYHLSAPIDADFLMKPTEQLYWAQDIASMTRSVTSAAEKPGVAL